jgi:Ti-type conjugative transfer relaxase TraA
LGKIEVTMALFHFTANILSRSARNTVRAVAYRAGCQLVDSQTAKIFNYKNKDVQHVELLLPNNAPSWAVEIQKTMMADRQKGIQAFVDIVESAETRINSQIWREYEFALHRELNHEQNIALAREFIQDQICSRGMAAQLNFHVDIDEKTGLEKPHCHVIVTTRLLDETGMGPKEREWNKKELLCELRQQWQDYSNFHLKLHGYDIQIDHRSHKERGIEMEPQPKMGRGVVEQERRVQALEGDENRTPITDKAKAFHDVQLRNLYRILRRPEVVLDIATKHHTTFMWADVQKVLHRYVDDIALFQRLESRLKNSKELILLCPEENEKTSAIYTTRTMLKAEKSLVEGAEALDRSKTHGAEERTIVQGISRANEELKKKGFNGLSQDQVKAIYHLSDGGQLKCMVGIAGAGKTTALEVCQDIWKESGYAVYGLAPTGKAAQNLEQGGISSMTLHKFLKEFDQGKFQYNKNSVLILDEAGMVDVERFSHLVEAVKQLGVKLVVVGDGAQLQPVEAGPAFRLVTERLGKSELHTVIRQKEDWQREATVLFGKQHTREAIQTYADRGHVHIVEEKLPELQECLENNDREAIVKLYEVSRRTASLMYREMAAETNGFYDRVKEHQDFKQYLHWKEIEKKTAQHIIQNGEDYKPILEARCLDPLKMALLFVNKGQDKGALHEEVLALLQKHDLTSLVGMGRLPGQSIDVRQEAKLELVKAWYTNFKGSLEESSFESTSLERISPGKTTLMMAFSNRDMSDLNKAARTLLKESGLLSQKEFTYNIKREEEDDFGRKQTFAQEKAFSVGDRIVFTRNNNRLGVKNGTLGVITYLNKQTVQVKMEDAREIFFTPNLNPYFDQGWAITIHKSQGTTVDRAYVLASYEMTQNLAYVSMTRHREDVQVFGSSLDFWRLEKLPEVLSKSGEKLSAADYLDARSLNQLMQEDDKLTTKIFTRLSNELEAMGAVSKKAFWQVADHFLGINQNKEIRVIPEFFHDSIREEVRAEDLLQRKKKAYSQEKMSHPQNSPSRINEKLPSHSLDAKVVEDALKQNMASFADDIFSSIGELYNAASSSSTERRYGKKGHIAVNLKTGAWIDHKDNDKSGGPLHMLTKLKGFSFKEAVEYGASWAGLSQAQLSRTELFRSELFRSSLSPINAEKIALKTTSYSPQQDETQELKAERQAKIDNAQALWNKGLPIQGTTAERYLREHRKIEGALHDDLRYFPSFKDASTQLTFPCLMAGARSRSGKITAVQLTFLEPATAAKADIEVPKKSFGVIKGSSVTLQEGSNLLFLTEGVETALSLKSVGVHGLW